MSTDTNDFTEIGYINIKNIKNNFIHFITSIDINLDKIGFLFIQLDSTLVPFKIDSINIQNTHIYIEIEDIDILQKQPQNKLHIFLENKIYNNNTKYEEDINITNFKVHDTNNTECGYVSNIYEYPNNKCIEITYNNEKKLIPFNKTFIKNININKNSITISDVNDLT